MGILKVLMDLERPWEFRYVVCLLLGFLVVELGAFKIHIKRILPETTRPKVLEGSGVYLSVATSV